MRHGKYFLYGFLIYFQDFHIQNIFRKEFYRAGESIPCLLYTSQAGSAVFLVEGLQLIIAVLLMALGLVIVINSLKAYFGAKKESEA